MNAQEIAKNIKKIYDINFTAIQALKSLNQYDTDCIITVLEAGNVFLRRIENEISPEETENDNI